jgi:NAD(P)H-dependent flavin oxidoreductase YrpB (nitropropane dioxygenase family)
MIRTRVCDVFGIDVAILNAPMASAAGGELAAAVSAAGGLGLIGAMGQTPTGFGRRSGSFANGRTSRSSSTGSARVVTPHDRNPAVTLFFHYPRATLRY